VRWVNVGGNHDSSASKVSLPAFLGSTSTMTMLLIRPAATPTYGPHPSLLAAGSATALYQPFGPIGLLRSVQ
jgi:hypothetical protein